MDVSQLTLSGNVTCEAMNELGKSSATSTVQLYELEDGFGIKNKKDNWFVVGHDVTLSCVGSVYDYVNVTWINVQSNGT